MARFYPTLEARHREFIAAQAVQSDVSVRITMRYRPGITSAMRLLHDGKVYGITGVLADNEPMSIRPTKSTPPSPEGRDSQPSRYRAPDSRRTSAATRAASNSKACFLPS